MKILSLQSVRSSENFSLFSHLVMVSTLRLKTTSLWQFTFILSVISKIILYTLCGRCDSALSEQVTRTTVSNSQFTVTNPFECVQHVIISRCLPAFCAPTALKRKQLLFTADRDSYVWHAWYTLLVYNVTNVKSTSRLPSRFTAMRYALWLDYTQQYHRFVCHHWSSWVL